VDPAVTPVATPVPEPIVATDVALLVQVPPAVASVNVVVTPEHTLDAPDIADGSAFTVAVLVT
jgi:hypothetical protein